jgi:signal transduction histidine kinase
MSSQLIFVVYFVYGLAFFGMGIAMALESGRSPALSEARVLRPLSAFGLIHGTHEWLEAYLLQAALLGAAPPAWVPWLRSFLLVTSFSSLALFAVNLYQLTSPADDSRRIIYIASFASYSVAILASAFLLPRTATVSRLDLLEGLSRYLLAVPSSVMATITLLGWARQSRRIQKNALASNLNATAFGFGIYALTQFVVHPMGMVPANFINEPSFLASFGFPIQVVRSVMAALITVCLLRATFIMDGERKALFLSAQAARLAALQKQESLRRELLRYTVHAQEEERSRIARELHDETAQELSALMLELATLRSMLKRQKAAIEKVDRLQALSRQISQGLYRLVRDLRPAQLDDLGLVPALRYLIGQNHLSMKIDASFKVQGDVRRFDPTLETVLFRVAQEALTNVARHAGTREACVELTYGENSVYMTVADQGQGFDALEPLSAPRGWGLAGMRERVESVGGQFRLVSAPGQGTIIEVSIPLVEG